MAKVRSDVEEGVRRALEAGDDRAAATLAIKGYGPEILGFLRARLRDDSAAGDAFAVFCEDLWRGLGGFAWRSSLRVWAFTLARHAADRHAVRARQARARRASLSALSDVVEEVRKTTLAHRRTANKERVRRLRERLSPEEQSILILRIDKQLSWLEIAQILATPDPDDSELARAAARLRKRFEAVKKKLRRLAEAEGILPRAAEE